MPYTAPATVEEACRLLASNPEAKVFAGSTDIMPQARAGRPLPETLVDLKTIPRLMGLSSSKTAWTIGAATPASRLTRDDQLTRDFPGLVEAASLIGSDQIQTRASLGGNLCNASPAADTGPSLTVNGAIAVIASTEGERSIPAAEVTTGPGRTALETGELIVEFILERPPPGTSDAYLRFTPRTEMDIAVVGVAAQVTLADSGECLSARVNLGAVAPTTVDVEGMSDALKGRPIDDAALDTAAQMSRDHARPIDDKRGTEDFRRHLAGVLTKRVLRIAAERAAASR